MPSITFNVGTDTVPFTVSFHPSDSDSIPSTVSTGDGSAVSLSPSGGTSHSPSQLASMEAQMKELYADRELLERELGTSDAEKIVSMVQSLENQLKTLYYEKEGQQLIETIQTNR